MADYRVKSEGFDSPQPDQLCEATKRKAPSSTRLDEANKRQNHLLAEIRHLSDELGNLSYRMVGPAEDYPQQACGTGDGNQPDVGHLGEIENAQEEMSAVIDRISFQLSELSRAV
jgi:hypothetical protein